MLGAIRGVESVEAQGSGFNVLARGDVRSLIFERVSQAGYKLLELRPVAMTLEDIFLEVVKRRNPPQA